MSDDILRRAVELYRQGKKEQAAGLLSDLLAREPQNASAWYGLAVCLDDPDRKRYCLQRTLSIDPEHAQARQMLDQLDAADLRLKASEKRSLAQKAGRPKPAPVDPLRQEFQLASARATVSKPRLAPGRGMLLAIGGVILFGLIAAAVVYGFSRLSISGASGTATPTATRTSLINFPPTWTPAPTETMRPYPTLKPSFTPLPTDTVVSMIVLTPSPGTPTVKATRTLKPPATRTPTP